MKIEKDTGKYKTPMQKTTVEAATGV